MMTESSMASTNATKEPEPAIHTSPHQSPGQTENPVPSQKTEPGPFTTKASSKEDELTGSEKHMENTVKAISQGMKAACLQWEQLLLESEQFEQFCPTRVDKLLQEAQAMEAHLLHQKEQLISRLKNLSQTLQVEP